MSKVPFSDKMRLDQWLHAARFYKTRRICHDAIVGGKVSVNQQRAKASKQIQVGDVIVATLGHAEIEATVLALSAQRQGAKVAQTLYEESQASISKRELLKARQKEVPLLRPNAKPDKRARSALRRAKGKDQ